MKKFLIIAGLVLTAGSAFAMSDFIVPKTWNYKITIEVETPEGIKAGSAVRQVRVRKELAGYINPQGGIITYRVYGEAVAIDLDQKGVLFYPLDWDSNFLIDHAFPTNIKGHWNKAEYYASLPVGKQVIQTDGASFVWLDNKMGEGKLRRLDSKDFEDVLGGKFKFRRSIIEISNEDVTWKLDALLNQMKGKFGPYSRESFQYGK